jgi:hypothetical protein
MYNCTLQNNIRIMYTMSLSMLISCTHIHFLFYFIDHPEVAGEATMDSRAAPPAIPIPRRQSPPPRGEIPTQSHDNPIRSSSNVPGDIAVESQFS